MTEFWYIGDPAVGARQFIEIWHRAERGEAVDPVELHGFARVEDLVIALNFGDTGD